MNETSKLHPMLISGIALLALVALMLGFFLLRPVPQSAPTAKITAAASAGKQLYISTMHPWIVQDHPGSCPICGMELVKMTPEQQQRWLKEHPGA